MESRSPTADAGAEKPSEDSADRLAKAQAKYRKHCLNPLAICVHSYMKHMKESLPRAEYKRICSAVTEGMVHQLSERCLHQLAENKKPTLDDVKIVLRGERIAKLKEMLKQHGVSTVQTPRAAPAPADDPISEIENMLSSIKDGINR